MSGIFLRGTNRGQAIVLIDGVRVMSASSGAATVEAIPLDEIDHIEILRGPASGLYGADAIGGVIQVFTRRGGSSTTGAVRAGYGTYDTREASGSIAGAAGPVRFAVSGSHRASRGFNAVSDPADFNFDPDRDGYLCGRRHRQCAMDVGARAGAGRHVPAQPARRAIRCRARTRRSHDHGRRDRAGCEQTTGSRATGCPASPSGQSTDDSVSRTGFGDFPFRTRERQYAWLQRPDAARGALTLGLERREERIAADAGFAVTARDTNAALALYQWRGGPHALQANVRRDDSSQFGGRNTGGGRYAFQLSRELEVSASAGTAFKAPSFNDLYFPGFSNPALRPETSRNVEAGVTWRASTVAGTVPIAWEATGVAYRNLVRDLIVFQCDAQFACAPQNVSDATLAGVTFGLDARRGDTSLTASLDLQDPRDERTDHLLPRRARRHGAINVAQRWGAVILTAEFVASSARYDDVDNLRRLAGYGIVNMTAQWTLAPGWSLLVRADNVFDKPYELAANYATGGAMLFAALRWQSR